MWGPRFHARAPGSVVLGALDPERERPQQLPDLFVLLLEEWEGEEAKEVT